MEGQMVVPGFVLTRKFSKLDFERVFERNALTSWHLNYKYFADGRCWACTSNSVEESNFYICNARRLVTKAIPNCEGKTLQKRKDVLSLKHLSAIAIRTSMVQLKRAAIVGIIDPRITENYFKTIKYECLVPEIKQLIFPNRLYNQVEVKLFKDTAITENHIGWAIKEEDPRLSFYAFSFITNPSYYLFERYQVVDMRHNVLWKYETRPARLPILFPPLLIKCPAILQKRVEFLQKRYSENKPVLFKGIANQSPMDDGYQIPLPREENTLFIEGGVGELNYLGALELEPVGTAHLAKIYDKATVEAENRYEERHLLMIERNPNHRFPVMHFQLENRDRTAGIDYALNFGPSDLEN